VAIIARNLLAKILDFRVKLQKHLQLLRITACEFDRNRRKMADKCSGSKCPTVTFIIQNMSRVRQNHKCPTK